VTTGITFSTGSRESSLGGPESWLTALGKLDLKRLVMLSVPLLAVVAIHSALVKLSAKIFGHSIEYAAAVGAACYFAGFFFLLCAIVALVMLPLFCLDQQRSYDRTALWFTNIAAAVICWPIALWAFYSYLKLLSVSADATVLKAVAIWTVGTILFFLVGLLFALWASPIMERYAKKLDKDSVEAEATRGATSTPSQPSSGTNLDGDDEPQYLSDSDR
jgi:hypothetical protein